MADMILANPMGAIGQAAQTVGAMDQLARLRRGDQMAEQDRQVAEQQRRKKLGEATIDFAGRAASALDSVQDPIQKAAMYKQLRNMAGMQGLVVSALPEEYGPEAQHRLELARARVFSQQAGTQPTTRSYEPRPMYDADGRFTGMGIPTFDPRTGAARWVPVEGGNTVDPFTGERIKAGIRVGEYSQKQGIKLATEPTIAADTERKKGEVQIEQAPIIKAAETTAKKDAEASAATADELARAQAALPGLRETVSSLKELSKLATYTTTGKVFDTAAKELGFGSTKGATARAKMISVVDNQVLPLLRDTFGAAFTAAEGERLRDTLLDPDATPDAKEAQLNAFMDQKVRDIETKQRQLGAQQSATTTGNATQGGGNAPSTIDDLVNKYAD